ncbi:MAG: plasmid pRiA4b ORF-3 family protein [Burkholderiaceae bacterium]|uniref:plasmid pRiA4b ORF-3 family protein n=1 Tax=Hydrogenophaga sp. TaxID=1904254 RepID=UPI00276D1CDD|nr:plasmid pRiA4b ORF-3 family protein [Hydrogenophaga sp.]MDP2065070.1 plasmid pRiA4b ORF-3 family protein [Burkholderiaceae bacterium]MDZ4145879.1 plasmid pRiA4b ORF-3 family protein [Burkholderiales bacterium]MDZ4396265.1 plasmid pRiA4b ORF-3 family protein [Hydrogenophaga sp.]
MQLLTAPNQRLLYLYDFGDEWLHTVTLMAFSDAHMPLPYLLKAQNGCPPEDCGGPPGAEYRAAAWYDADHEDHETARDMYGDNEPGSLDFAALQKAIAELKKTTPNAK